MVGELVTMSQPNFPCANSTCPALVERPLTQLTDLRAHLSRYGFADDGPELAVAEDSHRMQEEVRLPPDLERIAERSHMTLSGLGSPRFP